MDKSQFLQRIAQATHNPQLRTVRVPELDMEVVLRPLTLRDQQAAERAATVVQTKTGKTEVNGTLMNRYMLVAAFVEPQLDAGDAAQMDAWPMAVYNRLLKAMLQMSGLGGALLDQLAGDDLAAVPSKEDFSGRPAND